MSSFTLDPRIVDSFFKPTWRRFSSWMHLGIFLLSLQQLWFFLWIVSYLVIPPHTSSFIELERARLSQLESPISIQYEWVDRGNISPYIFKAVVASEDAFFFDHSGVMPSALQQGFRNYLSFLQSTSAKPRLRGGSTITQQLAKNLFLSPNRSLIRKVNEIMITQQLEAILSKEDILEIYVNVAEFGEGIFGVEAAAHYYFKTSAKKLTAAQSAQLAAMLPRPKYYQKHLNSPALIKRKNTLIRYI